MNDYIPTWKGLSETAGAQHLNPYHDSIRPEIIKLFKHVPSKVLDIGCSTGSVGRDLKNRFPQLWIWGMEINANSASLAIKNLDKVSVKQIFDLDASERDLLKSIDTILLLDVLEHMYDPWKVLDYIAKNASPSVQVITSIPNIANIDVLRDLAKGVWQYKDQGILDITHIRFFSLYEMRKMFYETGFKILHTNFSSKTFTSDDLNPEISYPRVVDLGDIKIIAKDQEHWLSLKTRQFLCNLQICSDNELSSVELALRCSPPPPCHTN